MEKKKRGINFNPEEVKVLLKITHIYKAIIENKKTDGPTWRAKEECWYRVEKEFNNCSNGPPRTAKQLKMKYEGIKKEMKKKHVEQYACLKGTCDEYPIPSYTSSPNQERELANVDDMESTSSQEECKMKGEDVQVKVEEIICECDNFIVPDIQPSGHSLLQEDQDVNMTTDSESVNFCNEDSEHNKNISMTMDDKVEYALRQNKYEEQKLASRRRSVAQKKRSQKAVANKLEELTTKKGKLIDILIKNAEEQNSVVMKNIEHQFEEHNIRMYILNERKKQEEMQTELLRYETEIMKRKLQNLINDQ